MAAKRDRIEAEALALTPADRAELAHVLIRSLDDEVEDPAEVDKAWKAEIRRRIARIESGEAELIPAEEVLRKARERLR